jgi:L-asparaginase
MQYGSGVTINFAGKIHSPVYVHKEHSFAIDPFSSGNFGVIGMMHPNRIDWLNNPKKSTIIPMPQSLASIPIVFAFPGATEDCLEGYSGKSFNGIIIVAYGSGNVSENMYKAISKLIQNGIKIVLVSNCKYGGVYSEVSHLI